MTRVAVLDDYQDVARSIVEWPSTVDVVTFTDHLVEEDAVVARLQGFDVVVAMRERTAFPRSVLERLPDLKLLVTTGPRNAVVDVAAAHERGVVVSGTWGIVSNTVELTWALILAAARSLPDEVASVRSGGWQRKVGRDLNGKTLGVLGLGNIGSQVAAIGKAFGMGVIAWSANLTDERAEGVGATRVEKNELFRRADVVTVHLVLSDRTRGLIGRDELALMKPTAFVVNTSRGPIIDDAALVDALERGAIAGAALDAFAVEPLPPDHPYRRLPNVVATPHIGYVTEDCYRIFYDQIVEDITAWLAGEPVRVISP
ncbi:MAG TPA: D-2-hydroxyacid dehydrogenase family protein [Acidimicrobiales bacterium]|nr:D-2-hydroxyacid dehydrogenase family protein [Acidimicrobiales bacterium]